MKKETHVYLLIALAFVAMAASYLFMPKAEETGVSPSTAVLEYLADIKYDLRLDEFNLSPNNYEIVNVRWMRDTAEVTTDIDGNEYVFYLTLEDKDWEVTSAQYNPEVIPEPTAKETLDTFYESIMEGIIEKDLVVEKLQEKEIEYFACPTDSFLYYIVEEDEQEEEATFRIVLSDDEDYGQGFVRLIKEDGNWLISSVTCIIDD